MAMSTSAPASLDNSQDLFLTALQRSPDKQPMPVGNYTRLFAQEDGSQWKVAALSIRAEDRNGFTVARGNLDDWQGFSQGGAWISEAFAQQQAITIGDRIHLDSEQGNLRYLC